MLSVERNNALGLWCLFFLCVCLFVFSNFFSNLTFVTVHEKTRYKSKIAILGSAHLKVQTLCYFMPKSDWLNGSKITSV